MTKKRPYDIMDIVCDILEEHVIGIDLYDVDTVQAVMDFLDREEVRYTYACEDLPDMEGYIAVFAWPDEENPRRCPHLAMFEVKC